MKISIVVPFYNEEPYIERCITALLAQDYPKDRYEIILVDNNSTDRSVEIVKRYPQVHLASETVVGDFAARNRGIRESTGDVVAFTDSDTAPDPDWLTEIARMMAESEVQLIVGNLQYGLKSKLLKLIAAYEYQKSVMVFSGQERDIYFGYTCNMAIRKTAFDTLGEFPKVFRNSDIVFLFKVLDAYGFDAVCYGTEVTVQRLEVSTLWRYLSKHHIYGRDFHRYGSVANARPLSMGERITIFRKTISHGNYSLLKSVFLLGLLGAGALSYDLGRMRPARS